MLLFRNFTSSSDDREAVAVPLRNTSPDVGKSRVPSRLRSVLLPDPEGPTTAKELPSDISNEMLSSTGPGFPLYRLVILFSSTRMLFSDSVRLKSFKCNHNIKQYF